MIHETIVTTLGEGGEPHITPIGIREEAGLVVIAPFIPSVTLDNLVRSGFAVVNFTDDVRVFAGCLTGRWQWPTRPASRIPGEVLKEALAHVELELVRTEDNPVRPRCYCREIFSENHALFRGFNRAQAAVVEAAILVSRLGRLPNEKIDQEIDYLRIAIQKTAGPRELQAWEWLMERIASYRAEREKVCD